MPVGDSHVPNPSLSCDVIVGTIGVSPLAISDCSIWTTSIIPTSLDDFISLVWEYATPDIQAIANASSIFKNSFTYLLMHAFYNKMIAFFNNLQTEIQTNPATGGYKAQVNINFMRWLHQQADPALTDPSFFFPDNNDMTKNANVIQINNSASPQSFGYAGYNNNDMIRWMQAYNATLKAYCTALFAYYTKTMLSGVKASHSLSTAIGVQNATDRYGNTKKIMPHLTFDDAMWMNNIKNQFDKMANATAMKGSGNANAPLLAEYCQTYGNFGKGWTRAGLLAQGDNRTALTLCGCFLANQDSNYPPYDGFDSQGNPVIYKDQIGCSTLCNNDYAYQDDVHQCNTSYCVMSNVTVNASKYSNIDGNITIENDCNCSGGGASASCQCVISNSVVNLLPGAKLGGDVTIDNNCTITSAATDGNGSSSSTLAKAEVWGGAALVVAGVGLAGWGLLAK